MGIKAHSSMLYYQHINQQYKKRYKPEVDSKEHTIDYYYPQIYNIILGK